MDKLDDNLRTEARLIALEGIVNVLFTQLLLMSKGREAGLAQIKADRTGLWDLMTSLDLNRLDPATGKELEAEIRSAHDRFYQTAIRALEQAD
jgi:hypothetical protein